MKKKERYTSKRSFEDSKNIDRRFLAQYVARKLKKKILYKHVISVTNILLDEIVKDLISGLAIKIGNFGKLFLKQLKERAHFNLFENKVVISKGKKILRFKLNEKFHRLLIKNLDIAKTFEEPKNE